MKYLLIPYVACTTWLCFRLVNLFCGWLSWRLGEERCDMQQRIEDQRRQIEAVTRAERRLTWCERPTDRIARMFGKRN